MPRNKSLLKSGHTSKKITIKPFSKPPSLPDNYYELAVSELLKGTLSVLDKHRSPELSLQHAYTTVVGLTSHQYGPRLYADLRQSMQQAARTVLIDDLPPSSTLKEVHTRYRHYLDYLLLCKHIFLPLDRTHAWHAEMGKALKGAAPGNGLRSIWQVGLEQFGARLRELGLDEKVYREWMAALLEEWDEGETMPSVSSTTSTDDLQAIWYLWHDLGWLQTLPLQQDLDAHWTAAELRWRSDFKAGSFLAYAAEKHASVQKWPWLPSNWLWSILEQCLLEPLILSADYMLNAKHLHPILEAELSTKKAMDHLTPVQQLWMLAGRVPMGQQKVATGIAGFARVQGLARVQRKVPTVVGDLLDFQDAINRLIASLPHGTELIHLKNTWEEVVNVDTSPPFAESLAKFLDSILRSTKKMDLYQSQAPDRWLARIISGLFVPIQAKDVFEAFYKRDLAKRLLWNRVVSMDVEKQVCSLLKAECGAGYTSKMEGMFQDVDWSRETMMVYKQSQTGVVNSASSVEMEVQVLTTGYWPVYPQYPNLHLPESLVEPQDRFTNHYKTKYQGRRMTWQYALGHCVVRANGFSKSYELIVSLCQALVLVQFTSSDTRLALPQLMQAVGMEDRDEMERILQSLALGKEGTRILRKLDFDADRKKKTRSNVDDRDVFFISPNFESNQRRIRINNIMMKETKEEREKTVEAVSRDRLYLIDAVLVRIMKARKTIQHQSLIAQVLEQVKVPAQVSDVKHRIESLIEREYMERDAADRNRYNYLA